MLSRNLIAALVTFLAIPQARAAEALWRVYVNPRFGTTVEVPAFWTAGTPPANGDGLTFTSRDSKASVTVWGAFRTIGALEEALADASKPHEHETVTYSQRQADQITLSGTLGDTVFYRRQVLTCDNKVWNGIEIVYPIAQRTMFDRLVAHMAQSLRGGAGSDTGSCGP
jgi:hypothetical protein